MKVPRLVFLLLLLGLAMALLSCGGDGSVTDNSGGKGAPPASGGSGITKLSVLDQISNSADPDSDGDYIPDDVEQALGTNPNDVDTDHDGIPDFVEIFGEGSFGNDDEIDDVDRDGLISAADADDDADGVNDGEQVDSDGDGISNYLEYYGYTYNWMSGRYAPWDGTDYAAPYFKSDPHQASTDQDPFDDATEVTGVNMDVSVRDPGDKPMVPAYPDIAVRLEGYSIALNKDITISDSESLSRGKTWERTMGASSSTTRETSLGLGYSYTAKASLTDFGVESTYSVNFGYKQSHTASTSYSSSTGLSIIDENSWSRATMVNPTDAAHITLFLKVSNNGTAAASNVVPTLTLRVGGHNVATFEPGNAQINLLEPGGVYPATPGVYWVIDFVDTGVGVEPLSLTLNELRALESGAPVSISVTQMAGDVMLKNSETGAYQRAGDWNEYMARINAVSADLFYDVGDGNSVHSKVFAGDRLTSPAVTLADAMVWAAGGRTDGSDVFIRYRDVDGNSQETSIASWTFIVDGETHRANGLSETSAIPADFNVLGLRLVPGSVVVARAPRDTVPGVDRGPVIHDAYYDPTNGTVNVVASDYDGIARVEFIDKDQAKELFDDVGGLLDPPPVGGPATTPAEMREDVPGGAFYTYAPPADYVFNGEERVRVTNVRGVSTARRFIELYTAPEPEPPNITAVRIDFADRGIIASVDDSRGLPLEWVRVYGAMFTQTLGFQDGYCEMKRVATWFREEDKYKWVCAEAGSGLWTDFASIAGAAVVAWDGQTASSRELDPGDLAPQCAGQGSYGANYFFNPNPYSSLLGVPSGGPACDPQAETNVDAVDLDTGQETAVQVCSPGLPFFGLNDGDPRKPGFVPAAYDNFLWVYGYAAGNGFNDNAPVKWLCLNDNDCVSKGLPSYRELNEGTIQALLGAGEPTDRFRLDDGIYIYRTNEGRYGKVTLTGTNYYPPYLSKGAGYRFLTWRTATYEFVTFNPDPAAACAQ